MGESTTVVRKGRLLLAIDDNLRSPDESHRVDIGKKPMFQMGLERDIVVENDRFHCETEFLGEDPAKSWWPSLCCKPELIRCVYREAIEAALDTSKSEDGKVRPVVTTWFHVPLPEPRFHTYYEETGRQVNVYWVTSGAINGGPMRPEPPADVDTFVQELWMVGTAEEVDREWAKYQSKGSTYSAHPEPTASPLSPRIKILNLPGY